MKRLKEKEAYLEVDEGGGEERAGLLRVPVGGAVEDPHRDRFWWRSEGSSGFIFFFFFLIGIFLCFFWCLVFGFCDFGVFLVFL